MQFPLVPHPDFRPTKAVEEVWVDIETYFPSDMPGTRAIQFWFCVNANSRSIVLPKPGAPDRVDGLWNTTCFEAFVRPVGSSRYFEWNLSPSGQWALYEFSSPREGMRSPPIDWAPHNDRNPATDTWGVIEYSISATPIDYGSDVVDLNLAAVIEEKNGTKSYWALAHPDGPPDFHDPACFVAHLPAIAAP